MRTLIEAMKDTDRQAVLEIYEEGIATGDATFETATPEWPQWSAGHLTACRLVARDAGRVLGWAALSPVSGRCVYSGVAEVSVYVRGEARRRGLGKALLAALVEASEDAGFWTLQAGIFPENAASIAICEACGFTIIGIRKRLGVLKGVWRDVLLLERRSSVVGA